MAQYQYQYQYQTQDGSRPSTDIASSSTSNSDVRASHIREAEFEGFPIETAPKDGTLLLLLVDYSDPDSDHPIENKVLSRTIGQNNFDHDGDDIWQFAGWCWDHDHYTEGKGKPVRWMYLPQFTNSDGV